MIQMYIVSTSGATYCRVHPGIASLVNQLSRRVVLLDSSKGLITSTPDFFLALLTYLENAERFAFLPLHEVPLPGLPASVPAIRSE